MSLTVLTRPTARTLICCKPCFEETAAGVGVVVGELLLHLADAQPVRDQFVGIDAHLILARSAAETDHVHYVRNGFELLLEHPILERLQLHQIDRGFVLFSVYQ